MYFGSLKDCMKVRPSIRPVETAIISSYTANLSCERKQTIALSHQLEQVAPLYRVKAARQETAYLENA